MRHLGIIVGDDPATIDAPTVATRRRSHPKGIGGGFATRF
jgi:hypothetical protein